MTKICCTCKLLKESSCFCNRASTNDGLSPKCRECSSLYHKQWYRSNPDSVKQRSKKWREDNFDLYTQRKKQYLLNNKESIAKGKSRWKLKNLSHVREHHRNYSRNRAQIDISYRLAKNLRTRLHHILSGEAKAGSAVRDLGCSIDDLRLWLEQQFQFGMTWENYGEWEIDHIIPLSRFDLTDKDQFKKANHWFNLQPLWAEENLKKKNHLLLPEELPENLKGVSIP